MQPRFGKLALSILALASLGDRAFALPYLNPTCLSQASLTTPKNGKGVYLSEDCQTAYVEPPILGKTELRALAPTKNLQFCESISQVNQITTRTVKTIDSLSQKIEQMVQDYEPLSQALNDLRAQTASALASYTDAQKAQKAAETQLASFKSDLRKAADAKEDCHLKYPTEPAQCTGVDQAHVGALKAYTDYRVGDYREASRKLDDAEGEYNDLSAKLTANTQKYAEAIKPMTDLWAAISDLQQKAFDLYKQYAGLNGATGQLVYFVDWNQLIADYEAANPKLKGHFTPIPIREGTVWGSVVLPGAQNESTIPAILSANLPGLKATGITSVAGDKVADLPTAPSKTLDSGIISSVSGQVVLTLNGACPFFKNDHEPAKDISFNELASYLVVNTTFTYEIAARRGYHADYHLAQLMTRLERSVKSGGFFSTSTLHEVIQDNNTTDWFKFKAYSEDSRYAYTPQQEEELKNTVKSELIDRALRQIAMFNAGGIQAPGVLQPPGSGAAAVSKALGYCPFWYCQAGSLVFGVLDSIFGSSEAVSNFKRNNNVWVSEDVEGIRMVDRSATVSFAPEARH